MSYHINHGGHYGELINGKNDALRLVLNAPSIEIYTYITSINKRAYLEICFSVGRCLYFQSRSFLNSRSSSFSAMI